VSYGILKGALAGRIRPGGLGETSKETDLLRRRIRPALLRWAVSVFCALVGALMLIAPHQFAGPSFAPLRPWITAWGAAFFIAGASLVTTSAVGLRGPFAVGSCISGALALVVLAFSFLMTGGWTGVTVYTIFGLAALLSALADQSSSPNEEGIDLFVLAAAVAGIANGLLLLLTPGAPPGGPYAELIGSARGWNGLLLLLGGAGVLVTRLRSRTSRFWRGLPQIVLGVAFLAWMLSSSIPQHLWTGILFYGGVASLLLVGPWLGRHLHQIDSSSLRVRLALAMASAAAFPLLFVATVATGWEEDAAARQQLALQEALANGVAADVGGALTQHLVGLVLVAENPVILSRPLDVTPSDGALLGDVGDVAPGLVSLGTFDSAGRPIVTLSLNLRTQLPTMAGEALKRLRPGVTRPTAFLIGDDDQPTIVLAAPIRRLDSGLGGIAVGELDRGWLQQRIVRGVADARLSMVVVDETGRVVVAAGEPIAGAGDLSGHPSVLALRDATTTRGTLRFDVRGSEYLAGYARVPETTWGVIVEQPASSALASVWASRELTFIVLLGAFIAASAMGVLLANRLAAPLALLARAAQALTTGASTSVIPASRIHEVRVLARAFAQMQTRLAARTVERERAEARLAILAHASSELTHSLDEDAIVQALASIVVAELADWCAVDTVDEDGRLQRMLVLHGDLARQSLAMTLTEPFSFDSDRNDPTVSGEPLLLPVVTPRQIGEMTQTAEEWRTVEWLGMRSMLVVPLRVRDQSLGLVTCVYGRGQRRYGPDDLALAQDLALRAALALDNARLYAAERTARADAEAAVRVREEFLAVAAHELKTPITSLRGFAELGVRAFEGTGTIDPSFARRTMETIDRQSARLSALVANLLEVARGTAQRDAIAAGPINLVDLVRSVIEVVRVRADQHPMTLTAPEPVEIVADQLRIEQVVTNLVDNAVKYSPPGSMIDITVRAEGETAEVVVRDYGMGIPREHRHRIFDRFFQAHVGEQSSGMGLGLYISQEIVRRHGGTLRAELPEDGGTRMIMTLPRASHEPRAPKAPTPSGQRSA
jgi:signal transduction histidine kinase